ncbi:MAG: hypothetical protein IJ015_01490 [Ruminococcus sp.]|nr:hypothetical protein [Ruminococcus sp.]
MWIADYVTRNKTSHSNSSCANVTGSENGAIACSAYLEHRDVPIVAPYGVVYNPPENEKSAIFNIDGRFMCLGVESPCENLLPGELMLYSKGGASIVLKNDGTVLINGKVYGE